MSQLSTILRRPSGKSVRMNISLRADIASDVGRSGRIRRRGKKRFISSYILRRSAFFFFKASLSSIHLQRASADTLTTLTNSERGGHSALHAASDNKRRKRGNAGWRNEILHKTLACIGLFARPGGPGTRDWNLLV